MGFFLLAGAAKNGATKESAKGNTNQGEVADATPAPYSTDSVIGPTVEVSFFIGAFNKVVSG